ncbi:MAG: hypothetical protein RL095_469 [Verrucomicrobiota bacterium]|jgi:hypothetical protein
MSTQTATGWQPALPGNNTPQDAGAPRELLPCPPFVYFVPFVVKNFS